MNQEKIQFIQWLINRLQFKYNCKPNDIIIQKLDEIIKALQPQPIHINISNLSLDKILSKYYVDFMLDKCEDMNVGFTDNERVSFRNNIKNILRDIVNKNIPKDFLIKG